MEKSGGNGNGGMTAAWAGELETSSSRMGSTARVIGPPSPRGIILLLSRMAICPLRAIPS